jgi:hypothetical protein
MCELWLEVNCCAEVVEGAGCLARAEVQQAQVVCHQPLKRVQVQCTLQAGDGSNVALHQQTQTGQHARQDMVSGKVATGQVRQLSLHADAALQNTVQNCCWHALTAKFKNQDTLMLHVSTCAVAWSTAAYAVATVA